MYVTSHDGEFEAKRDDVLRVYYEAPKSEHIVYVDEKTGIQTLGRRSVDIPMDSEAAAAPRDRVHPHGTLCWMGACDVRRGKPFGFT